MLIVHEVVLAPQTDRPIRAITVSGTIDTKEEMEVYANAVAAGVVLEEDEDDGPRAYVTQTLSHLGGLKAFSTALITIGTWVSWTIYVYVDIANLPIVDTPPPGRSQF